jgi:hypothetical protein
MTQNMTRCIVDSLAKSFDDSANLIIKLINECPPDLWTEKADSWPIWQHVAHCASAIGFFCPGEEVPLPGSLSTDVANLKIPGTGQMDKKVILDYFKTSCSKAEAFIAGLTDADLIKENTKLKTFGLNWTQAQTMVSLSSHFLYHLGSADAVLRSHGHKGIF